MDAGTQGNSANVWTREMDEQIFALKERGLSFSRIAAILGKSKNAANGRYLRLKKLRETHGPDVFRVASPELTQEEVEQIIALRKLGLTTPAIAKKINRSADAVRKKIKLHCQFEQFSARDKSVSFISIKQFRSTKPENNQVFSEAGGVTIFDLEPGMCRWPVGDPKADEFRFCGANAVSGRSYCCRHHSIAYYHSPTTAAQRRDAERSHNRALAGGLR